ncbi:MAG TPA: preprotein translocase subunit SecE [Gammaproteobacteria bacterium]|uniref:preprotein translocase subunit SecE n=1 Tax=Immundisolibacter sp. TaxID=1934948 RepID=UPI000E9E78B1|nr:preprotein translocase subunit SecE [Gammaproteobacteria bacterium]HCZ49603.1 preprotein translocase subunit SecE [Gammaproteobacteria bacterium]MCH79041.1 preprotein translocase subunit SecE [Gammaproteobacteria bacterium]
MTVNAPVAKQRLADRLLLILATALLAAGIAGFYLLHDQPQVVRVLTVLAAVAVAVVLAVRSAPGARLWEFMGESRTELRRVVWPTRRETLQMTGVVFLAAVMVGLMLWFFDWVISLAIGAFMGLGG